MKSSFISMGVCAAVLMAQSAYAAPAVTTPLYKVTLVESEGKAINYRNLNGAVEIDFKGTSLLPGASGRGVVKNRAGVAKIKADFENLPVATLFGSEYLTYVVWAVSPEGKATNLGELVLKDGKARVSNKTPLQALSLIVTAEPYFAVAQPSNVVVLENAIQPGNKENIALVAGKYQLIPRGQYTQNIAVPDQQTPAMNKETPFNVYQARNAVRIARAAGAEADGSPAFKNAERLLALSETKAGGFKGRALTAREAVQSAEESRATAVQHQAASSLASEHEQTRQTINSALDQADAANAKQAAAERAKGQSDIERAAALSLASSAIATSSSAQADAKAARVETAQAKDQTAVANRRAQSAEDKSAARAKLYRQLNAVLMTQDTARGLIVNMSDVLFRTGSAGLRPAAREKLAKIAGIVLSNPGLRLDIEGHTDSVGTDGYNQKLSENRASAARDYLVSQGVPGNTVASRGYGESVPMESNGTAQGRQINRRVEVVVSGEAIGTLSSAK